MECTNCTVLFQMINALNDNIASILSGYELVVNVINNHESEINKLSSFMKDNGQSVSENNTENHIDDISDIQNDLVFPSLIPVAANVDIVNSFNVESEECSDLKFQKLTTRCEPSEIPQPEIADPNPLTFDTISDKSSEFSSSESYFNDNSSVISEQTLNDCKLLNETFVVSDSDESQSPSYNVDYIPYEAYDSQVFNLFDANKLDDSTVYTHFFNNRSVGYYGDYPYHYGKTVHKAKNVTENPYLQKILNYVNIAYPIYKFNSAMVQRYKTGDDFIPRHSDNEDDIERNSVIITISLGDSRSIQFKEKGGSELNETVKLNHGDCLVMSQESQKYFTHEIAREKNKGMRLSITLRLIKPSKESLQMCDISTQTLECENLPVSELNPVTENVSSQYHPRDTNTHVGSLDYSNSPLSLKETHDGYQHVQEPQLKHSKAVHPFTKGFDREYPSPLVKTISPKRQVDTLYISSSMFRHLDPVKLSTAHQTAQVLFYPGADASQMASRLIRDPRFNSLDKQKVKKVFVMVGTNNVDRIANASYSFSNSNKDISDLLYKIWESFGNARIHVINLLPRQNPDKNIIVHDINQFIFKLCQEHGLTFANTEQSNDSSFCYSNGVRKDELFSGGYDNVHLNKRGYAAIGKYLKYLAHT